MWYAEKTTKKEAYEFGTDNLSNRPDAEG